MIANSEGIKVDLHVHSPASSDYLGPKTDSKYVSILKECRRAKVGAIAITDHNTVNGCATFERLKKEARLNYELNLKRDGAKEFLDQIKDELSLFDDISLIHGVEISVYPNIHIILVFDSEVALDSISEFLKTNLGLNDAVENGSPDKYFSQSPLELLKLATAIFKDNYFCILPHVDSTNGVWNELSGQQRADLFKSNEVLAVQVLNPDTKRHFLKNIFNNPDYAKKVPLQIIQASDFHGGTAGEIARQFSMIDLDSRVTFASLRQYFLHKRTVKVSSDFIDETYKQLTSGKQIIPFEFQNKFEVGEQVEFEILKAFCACMNTKTSLIEFNIRNSTLSPNDEAQNIMKLMNEKLLILLDPSTPCGMRISDLSHSPTRQRHLLQITQNTRLRIYEGKAYIASGNKSVEAGTRDIEQIVVSNLYVRFGKSKQLSLSKASNRLLMISNSFPALSTAYRIDALINRDVLDKLDRHFEVPNSCASLEKCVNNGIMNGDFVHITQDNDLCGGRVDKHYLRVTPPMFSKKGLTFGDAKALTASSNSIVVFPEGGVHYIDKAVPLYTAIPIFTVSVKSTKDTKPAICLLPLCVFLKSSFLLWYVLTIHETDDLFELTFKHFSRLPIPADPDLWGKLQAHGEKIMAAEKKLLKDVSKQNIDDKTRVNLVRAHNTLCDGIMLEADGDIIQSLKFSEQEVKEISRTLNDLRLYDYGLNANLAEFSKKFSDG